MMAGGLALGGLLIGGPAGLVMSAGAVVVAAINLGGALAPMFKGSKKAAAKAPAGPSTPPPSNRPASRPASPGPTVRQSVNANTLKASSHMDMGNGFSVEVGTGKVTQDMGGGVRMELGSGKMSTSIGGGMMLNADGTISFEM